LVSPGRLQGYLQTVNVIYTMPANFLVHIVDFCQLNCKHCYLNKGSRAMPLDMLRTICEDFLQTDFPLPQSDLILSGGEPLLHPNLVEACDIVRKLNGHITMSTNRILIPKYIHIFHKNDRYLSTDKEKRFGTHQIYGMDRDEEICGEASGKGGDIFARGLYRGWVHRPNTGFERSS